MGDLKTTILLVDDDEQFLETVSERIRMKGFNVICAKNGREGIEMSKQHDIQVAVVDMSMPDIDGLVTITKIKEQNPKVKTLLLTAFGDEKLKETTEALNSGYFEKQEMNTFWDFIKGIPKKLENTMAAAGMAEGGDAEDAEKIEKGTNGF